MSGPEGTAHTPDDEYTTTDPDGKHLTLDEAIAAAVPPVYRYSTETLRDGRPLTQAEADMLNADLDARRADPSLPMSQQAHDFYFPPNRESDWIGLYSEMPDDSGESAGTPPHEHPNDDSQPGGKA